MAAGRVMAQDPQPMPSGDAPKTEKKQENGNPAGAAAQKTRAVTIQAAEKTKNLGEQTFVWVRDWESSWVTGVYVPKDRELAPLTGEQRTEIYLRQTLTTPGAYIKRMFAAGIDQARGSPPQWHGGFEGYGQRFASREGQFIVANSLAALGNAALQYEPRYDLCRCSGFRLRTRHALARNFLTYTRSEHNLRPQWALYAGAFGGGVVSASWKPHPRNALAEGGRAMAAQVGFGALLNFFTEFSREINRKLGAKQ